MRTLKFLLLLVLLAGCTNSSPPAAEPEFDLVIRDGMVYDGSGGEPFAADIGIVNDRVVAIDANLGAGKSEIDADGLAVAPGFINVLSWATESLIADGRSQSDIRQGVTLEVFGEGWSMGPFNEAMKQEELENQGDIKYDITWTTLDEYLRHLVDRGISPNVASFVGATTIRIHVLGYQDRAPNADELQRMRELVRQAMEDGALGVGTSLIYAPAFYADTEELVELASVAAEYGGTYISHIRSEGNSLLEAVDELITVAREANIAAEIYHLKAAGKENWGKLEEVFERVEAARREGLRITADMYTYTAGATGLYAAMPPWVQEGGHDAWVQRLQDPKIRAQLKKEMTEPSEEWENLLLAAGSADNVILIGFKSEALKPLTGKTLGEVARERGKSPEETAMDLVIEDDSRVTAAYFIMSEDNIRKKIARPWISFGSDEASRSLEGVFRLSNPHPRAMGNFARLLGKYVREEQVIPLAEAIRRLTALPADNFNLPDRGQLVEGNFADVVVFDPDTVIDHATFAEPHQYSTGVSHVFVNGVQVLKDGEHTGALPGRVVRGPGYKN